MVEPGVPVVALERVRLLDGEPLSLDASYLPADIGEPLLGMDLAQQDVFSLLEKELQQPLGSAAVSIEAIIADRTVADLLRVPNGSALLFLERLTFTESGRPIDLEFVRYRGDRMSLSGWLHRTPRLSPNQFSTERG
jgi:GntR family transcriptional regulator